MSDKLEKQARHAVGKRILPIVRDIIGELADEIYEETQKHYSGTHAPEIRIGAQNAATRAVMTELTRYLLRDKETETAVDRWEFLSEERIKRWFG